MFTSDSTHDRAQHPMAMCQHGTQWHAACASHEDCDIPHFAFDSLSPVLPASPFERRRRAGQLPVADITGTVPSTR